MIGAIRFTPTELGPYAGWNVVKMKFKHNAEPGETHDATIIIYDEGTATSPGPILATKEITVV
ncbi:unnamed protein product, partial [marine sediment metagenome]